MVISVWPDVPVLHHVTPPRVHHDRPHAIRQQCTPVRDVSMNMVIGLGIKALEHAMATLRISESSQA